MALASWPRLRSPELPARLSFSRATSKAPTVFSCSVSFCPVALCLLPAWSVFGSSCLCSLHRLVASQQPELERVPRECRLLGALFHASSRATSEAPAVLLLGRVSASCAVVALSCGSSFGAFVVRVWFLLSLLPASTCADQPYQPSQQPESKETQERDASFELCFTMSTVSFGPLAGPPGGRWGTHKRAKVTRMGVWGCVFSHLEVTEGTRPIYTGNAFSSRVHQGHIPNPWKLPQQFNQVRSRLSTNLCDSSIACGASLRRRCLGPGARRSQFLRVANSLDASSRVCFMHV